MKAWVLHEIGDIRYEDVPDLSPSEKEVMVKVRAVGICGSDIPRIYRDGAHRMPLIPGHEFSGEVVEAGEAAADRWMNKRVGVFPLIPCRECIPCRKGFYEMCRSYGYLGSRQDGGFAEYVRVPAANLIELPGEVSFEQAAMLEPMSVAVHAMRRVQIRQSDTVVVSGLGTIGMLLTMFLLERGACSVLVVGNKDYQRSKAIALGLPGECFCDSRTEDVREWILSHTPNAGADVFFECVGKEETAVLGLDVAAPSGQVCLVGNPYSDMSFPRDVYWKILRNQLRVTGTWNSSFRMGDEAAEGELSDWEYVLDLLKRERIRPRKLISHRFDLQNLDQGLHIMRDKTEDYLKIIAVSGRDF